MSKQNTSQAFWTGFCDGLAFGPLWRLLKKLFTKDKA